MLRLKWDFELLEEDKIVDAWTDLNLIPKDSVAHIANVIFGDTPAISTFYMGLFSQNYVPSPNVKSTDLQTVVGEFTGYAENARPLWNRSFDGVGSVTNSAARAEFTSQQDRRIYGGFLISDADKGGNTGLILSIARFTTPRDIVEGQVLRVAASLVLIPTEVA